MDAILAESIGQAAWNNLHSHSVATVMGVISQGVFLKLPNDRIAFLTYRQERGPLTINLSGEFNRLQAIGVGMTAHIKDDEIVFSLSGLTISTGRSTVWTAPPPVTITLKTGEVNDRLAEAGRRIIRSRPELEVGYLLSSMLNLDVPKPVPEDFLPVHTGNLIDSLHQGDHTSLVEAVQPLLGRGDGLTPWGDDMILGWLFTLNRWKVLMPASFELSEINTAITDLAYRRTTALSAALIECAAEGQADERLVLGLDGILTGTPGVEDCVRYLLDWGNSSGAAFLAGAAFALQAFI